MGKGLLALALALALPAAASAGTLFVVEGRGWGHGIGMSQYGAQGFAGTGWGYERILHHYYPGTTPATRPGRKVRVLLVEGRARVVIGSARPFRRGSHRLRPGPRVLTPKAIKALGGSVRYRPGAAPLTLGGNGYRGELVVRLHKGKLRVVNELPLDRYLRGVVPWEMPHHWHAEALKAQAVVARSYALATLKPGKHFDLHADVRSQVYGGIRAEEDETNLAVGATAGRILTWNGRPAWTFYHSTSGGRTAAIRDVWPDARPLPYLVSVPDPHDWISKHHRWGPVLLTPVQVGRRLGVEGVRDLVLRRGPDGRVTSVVLKLEQGRRVMRSQDFRRKLELRSTWFTLKALSLDPPLSRALRDRQVKLRGFVRGLSGVRLERKVAPGRWSTVARVRPRANGRFTAVVRAERTTDFRLAAPQAAGAGIRLKVG